MGADLEHASAGVPSPSRMFLFLASNFEMFISFEQTVQIKFNFHIRIFRDEVFQIRSILNMFWRV